MSRGPIPDKPRDRPRTDEVIRKVRVFMAVPEHFNGGALHCTFEGNLMDWVIASDRDYAAHGSTSRFDGQFYCCGCGQVPCALAVEIATDLLAMTQTQRRLVVNAAYRPYPGDPYPDSAGGAR